LLIDMSIFTCESARSITYMYVVTWKDVTTVGQWINFDCLNGATMIIIQMKTFTDLHIDILTVLHIDSILSFEFH
jgi:hypothetical protein